VSKKQKKERLKIKKDVFFLHNRAKMRIFALENNISTGDIND
jgi:hypothetical protein